MKRLRGVDVRRPGGAKIHYIFSNVMGQKVDLIGKLVRFIKSLFPFERKLRFVKRIGDRSREDRSVFLHFPVGAQILFIYAADMKRF